MDVIMRYAFNPIIMMVQITARIVVIFRFTKFPIISLLLVNRIKGIMGRGIRKLRIT